jgi:peptidoglycan/LPS O-acetylase OafA/YrhL
LCVATLAGSLISLRLTVGEHARIGQIAFPYFGSAFGMSVICVAAQVGRGAGKIPGLAVLSGFLGQVSYSVYLFHIVLIAVFPDEITGSAVADAILFCLLLTLGAASFYRYFEKPVLDARPNYRSAPGGLDRVLVDGRQRAQ